MIDVKKKGRIVRTLERIIEGQGEYSSRSEKYSVWCTAMKMIMKAGGMDKNERFLDSRDAHLTTIPGREVEEEKNIHPEARGYVTEY
jgi:hypothetical protein